MLEYLKSLFVPKKMRKLRFMSVLFAICSFVITAYAFQIPVKSYYNRTTSKIVESDNLGYLKSISEIPENNVDVINFVNAIKNTNPTIKDGVLSSDSLGLVDIDKGQGILGVLTRNTSTLTWVYDDVNTEIAYGDANKKPEIFSVDGGIKIEYATSDVVSIPGVVEGDNINVIEVTVNNRNKLKVNGTVHDFNVDNNKAVISISNNKLVVNNRITEIDASENSIIYFIPNHNVDYFEKNVSYTSRNGYLKNIKFIISLSEEAFSFKELTAEKINADVDNQEYFFIVASKTSLIYLAHPYEISNVKHGDEELTNFALSFFYNNGDFSFEDINPTNFSSYMTDTLVKSYIDYSSQMFLLSALFYVILLPLILCLLYYLMFKKQGRMKTFKEYYNIGGIANIVSFLITFVVLWFFPQLFSVVYISSFGLWYLFVCYKINNAPEVV